MYEYKARVLKIYDGDSFSFLIDLGLNTFVEIRARLNGIDTPEIRGKEKIDGEIVKEYVEAIFDIAEKVDYAIIVRTHKTGKFGRWLVDIQIGEFDLKELIFNEFTHYDMRMKRKWKNQDD